MPETLTGMELLENIRNSNTQIALVVIADANFPAHRLGQRVIRADGHGVPELLDAILTLLPLDPYSDYQAGLMQVVPGDPTVPVIWEEYKAILDRQTQDQGY